jgi:hypothetical protein
MLSADELKRKVDIVQLIGQKVKLSKDGPRFKGLCPLHSDTKPSLAVYPKEQTWHCFGCDRHGDAFQWIIETEKVDFKMAFAQLQARYGDTSVSGNVGASKRTTWDITDATGQVVAQHTRCDSADGSKKYFWHRDGKDSLGGLKVENLPLYGLKNLFDSSSVHSIIITEGEKAADALIKRGYIALGTVTGAHSCPAESAFHPLVGFETKMFLWPDNDAPGWAHMDKIANHLLKLGIQPYLLKWKEAPPKGDAFDFIEKGLDLESLLANAAAWCSVETRVRTVTKDDQIEQHIDLVSGNTICLKAENVRKERTGIHARLSILTDDIVLAWDVFNIERNEERQRLAKSAFERLPNGVDNLCDLPTLKGHLDNFTSSLWDKAVSQDMPELVTPPEEVTKLIFLAEPYILRGGGTILFAPPGAGKSYIGLLLAVSIDAGISKLWLVNVARVLFINIERSAESVSRRLSMVNKALGLPATRPLLILNRRGRALADISEAVRRAIRKYQVDLVILDSISRFGSGDLNENLTANKTIDALSSLCPTWLALGHTPRADDSHAYGSVHFDAGADLMVKLTSVSKDAKLGIGLTVTKSNDTPKGRMETLALAFDGDGLTDARLAKPGEFGELALEQKTSLSQEITQYLLEHGEAATGQIATDLGRNYSNISTLLNSSEEFVHTRTEKKTKFYGLKEKRLC